MPPAASCRWSAFALECLGYGLPGIPIVAQLDDSLNCLQLLGDRNNSSVYDPISVPRGANRAGLSFRLAPRYVARLPMELVVASLAKGLAAGPLLFVTVSGKDESLLNIFGGVAKYAKHRKSFLCRADQ